MKKLLQKLPSAGASPLRIRKILEWGCACGLLLTIVLTAAAVRYQTVCARVCGDTLAAAHFSQQRYSGGSAAEIAGAGCCFGTGDSRNAVCRNQAAGGADPAHSHAGPAAHSPTDAAPCGQQPTGTVQAGRNPVCSPPLFRLLAAGGYLHGAADRTGQRQGHNWFCVLYPALCVGSSEARYADTEENALVFGGYQVRFALLDTARSVWQKITD